MLLHPTLRTGVDTAWLSDVMTVTCRVACSVASAESSSPVTCYPALPTFTLLGQGDSLPSYSLAVRKGEPLGSWWMRTRTVYADPKSEPNQRGSSLLPSLAASHDTAPSSSLSRSTGLACPQLVSPLVSSSTPTNWRLNSLIRFR